MDTIKTGLFLKQLRKEHNLTQEELGAKIGVTNKTVSRWENGNYFPPVDCLVILSDFFSVSINEIISGERISDDKFEENADRNLTESLEMCERQNKTLEKNMYVLMIVSTIISMIVIILSNNSTVVLLMILLYFISNVINIVAIVTIKDKYRKK